MLNYVILTTHSSHLYSIWDFTHTCNPTNLPLTCESLPLCGLQDLFVGHEQILLTPPCLMGFHFINASSMGTTCQFRTHIHGNPARLCPWEPRTTPLFSTISNIPLLSFSFLSFFSRIFVCGPFRPSLSPLGMCLIMLY